MNSSPFLLLILNNKISDTNNINVNEVALYIAAVIFLLSIFPIHIYNYIYVNTEEKYASINATAFRYIKLFNINTVKNKPNEIQMNGKNKKMDLNFFQINFYRIFNQLCIHKVVQLSDFGLKNQNNAYAALIQNGITVTAYKFLQMNGNSSKLKNYTVLNEEHSSIRYYAKAVTIINALVIIKILIIYLTEKLYEFKNKKK